ncbi:MAG: tRNA preQ1(34) S-adenosylmethionine ribosyltransferase-isomerase QueA [Hyphomicrobium sp.]
MRTDLFDFFLPDERIALRPCTPRDSAKLLVVHPDNNDFIERYVRDLPEFLTTGDTVVVNDTKVIPSSLAALRLRGDLSAKVDLNLIKNIDDKKWRAFARPLKRLKPGDVLRFYDQQTHSLSPLCEATIEKKLDDGEVEIIFNISDENLKGVLGQIGLMPLPPYISLKRPVDTSDFENYQTIFAKSYGAVASPTASLHFTSELISVLKSKGVSIEFITLHVGAGTFLPVKTEDTENHKIHSEWAQITKETAQNLNHTRKQGGRIIAIGTTVMRTLETSTDDNGIIKEWSGETSLFIKPGYKFKSTDILMTNFHLPKSTLFMLVSAFSGLQKMHSAYSFAIKNNYRFYSYGDACLLFLARGGK